MKNRMFELCILLEKQGVSLTVQNVSNQSLFTTGGTVTDEKMIKKYIDLYQTKKSIDIGFCQPQFYKPAAWTKAKKIMNKLCALNVGVSPHDFGRGKGKYTYSGHLNHEQLAELLINNTKNNDLKN